MEYTIHGLHEKLVNKDISSVELTKKIIAHRNLVEGEIHAFLSMSDETALERAAEVDKKIASLAATAAALPPEEPPGTLSRFQGLWVGPK